MENLFEEKVSLCDEIVSDSMTEGVPAVAIYFIVAIYIISQTPGCSG
jgi:hypothetical protein